MFAAILILVNLLFYLRTLKYQGICDDIPVFNQQVDFPTGGWFYKKWMYFWYHLHGRKYASFRFAHKLTLGIHILNACLVYWAFGANLVSFTTALLFSLNPVGNQCSIWISGKGYSLNTTMALLMWLFPLFSPIPYLFGTYFCGASLLFFPLIFLFTPYWYMSLIVLLGLYREYGRVFNKNDPNSKYNTESNTELLAIKPRKLVIVFKTYAYYIINTITARILGFYHKYLFLHGVSKETNKDSYKPDKFFYMGIAFALVTLITRDIGLLWFSISIMMWLNLISFNQTISNRYIYLGLPGLMYFMAKMLLLYPPLVYIVLTYYAIRLWMFGIFYLNEYWSIEYSAMEQPNFFYPWQNRAVYCFQNNNFSGALANMIKASELRPKDWKLTYNLSQIALMMGNIKGAREKYQEALNYTIEGREEVIKKLMERLGNWISEIEAKAKESPQVEINMQKFDMQR